MSPELQEMGEKFYQYTVIDEASRERFIFPYKEQSSFSSRDFLQKAIAYFGYAPSIIQTDNGGEFTYLAKTDRIHPFTLLCRQLKITHKLIRPRTPRHNGKVERQHRIDEERFYKYMRMYNLADGRKQLAVYQQKSNNYIKTCLNLKTPNQVVAMYQSVMF